MLPTIFLWGVCEWLTIRTPNPSQWPEKQQRTAYHIIYASIYSFIQQIQIHFTDSCIQVNNSVNAKCVQFTEYGFLLSTFEKEKIPTIIAVLRTHTPSVHGLAIAVSASVKLNEIKWFYELYEWPRHKINYHQWKWQFIKSQSPESLPG